MDTFTLIVSTALGLFLGWYVLRLAYTIFTNLVNGRKFHKGLEQDFLKLRLSKMLGALGINKTDYIYQTRVRDIKQQMNNCEVCENTAECDEKLASSDMDINNIEFCNNESELQKLKQEMKPGIQAE